MDFRKINAGQIDNFLRLSKEDPHVNDEARAVAGAIVRTESVPTSWKIALSDEKKYQTLNQKMPMAFAARILKLCDTMLQAAQKNPGTRSAEQADTTLSLVMGNIHDAISGQPDEGSVLDEMRQYNQTTADFSLQTKNAYMQGLIEVRFYENGVAEAAQEMDEKSAVVDAVKASRRGR